MRGDFSTDERVDASAIPEDSRASLTAVASDTEQNVDGGRAPCA